MIKVLIADDEMLARESIKLLLSEQNDIGDIWEAENGNQAKDIWQKYKPDLVFLDIQMPGKTGLQLADEMPEDTVVVFATAYDKYAITAFELNAIDYLLKPYDDERFFAALDRARERIASNERGQFKDLHQLIHHMATEQDNKYKSRLIVRDPGRIRLVNVEDINYITAAGNYAEVHLFNGKMILHRETLTTLESQLDPKVFIRIHRSTIIRQKEVSELRTNDSGDYSVVLKTGECLTMSRRNRSKLEDILTAG